jgi:hypothetical protein
MISMIPTITFFQAPAMTVAVLGGTNGRLRSARNLVLVTVN